MRRAHSAGDLKRARRERTRRLDDAPLEFAAAIEIARTDDRERIFANIGRAKIALNYEVHSVPDVGLGIVRPLNARDGEVHCYPCRIG